MSASPSSQQHYEKRDEERKQNLTAEKRKVDEANQKKYAEQKERHEKEVEEKQKGATKKVTEAAKELGKARERQSEELTRVRAEISTIIKQQQELQSIKGKEEVENVKKELEKKKKELELQAELHRSQLDETLKIMEGGEKMRQDVLKEISKAHLEEKKLHNEKILAKNDELHKQKLETVNKLMDVEKMRYDEEAKQMDKTEGRRFDGFVQVQGLTRSLALQDNFQPFKQRCEHLRKLYKTFLTEYNDLEPTLLKCDERMLKGKQFEDYCSDDLQDALRKFREEVDGFSAEGSTDEQQFAVLIGELTTHVTTLLTEFNNIDAKIELFNDEDGEGEKKGITEQIFKIKSELDIIAPLIQKFNVIPRQHFAETLALQMQHTHASSSNGRAAIGGPPVYTEKKAIREN